jgi:hypothetical protein
MEQELAVEDVLALAREKAEEVDEAKVYFALRKMKLKHLTSSTVEAVKYAVALTELGLPITAPLMTALLRKVHVSVLAQLHNLGDKHILVLKRSDVGRRYEWVLSPVFHQHYYGSAEEEVSNGVEA